MLLKPCQVVQHFLEIFATLGELEDSSAALQVYQGLGGGHGLYLHNEFSDFLEGNLDITLGGSKVSKNVSFFLETTNFNFGIWTFFSWFLKVLNDLQFLR